MLPEHLFNTATKIIDEALFIGLIERPLKEDFRKLITYSRVNYDMVVEILRKGKRQLVECYDRHAKDRTLDQLKTHNREAYEKLYRAKFLANPSVKN